jgi:hypothetical protein
MSADGFQVNGVVDAPGRRPRRHRPGGESGFELTGQIVDSHPDFPGPSVDCPIVVARRLWDVIGASTTSTVRARRGRIAASTNLHPCASHRHRYRMATMTQRCSQTIVLYAGAIALSDPYRKRHRTKERT